MKILGIDFGTKRIGLAISDETQTFSRELNVLSPKEFWSKILSIISENEIVTIVLGMPVNMEGGNTPKTLEVKDFKNKLQKKIGEEIKIDLVDERLSSKMAENIAGNKHNIDSLAAQIFLQTYLDKRKNLSGYSLIEVMVVVSIMSLLGSLFLVAVDNARIKARDAKRKADLLQVSKALELYYASNSTYQVAGTGSNNNGDGWLSVGTGSLPYVKSVTQGLKEAGIISSSKIEDPRVSPSYMIYLCSNGQKYSLYGTLERPTAQDIANADTGCNGSGMFAIYGKNYMVGYKQ